MEELKEEFDWEYYGGKHHESVFTKFYQCHILPRKFNIDKRKVHLSALIRSGEITREAAMVELSQPLYDKAELARDFEFVCKKLDFSISELEAILDAQPVRHLDFKSDRSFIEPLLKIGRYFGVSTFK